MAKEKMALTLNTTSLFETTCETERTQLMSQESLKLCCILNGTISLPQRS